MGSVGRVFGPLFDPSFRRSIAARMAGFAYVVSLILVALGHLCLYAFLAAVAHASHDDHTVSRFRHANPRLEQEQRGLHGGR